MPQFIPNVQPLPEAPVIGTSVAKTGVTGESNMGVGVSGACIGGPGRDVVPSSDGVFGSGKNGVHGTSSSATDSGVLGENNGGGNGVSGSANSPGAAGVSGNNAGTGFGVNGRSTQGIGVLGSSSSANGVQGVSVLAAGVRGTGSIIGVQGDSDPSGVPPPWNAGVWGDCNAGTGVFGSSSKTTGVFGYSKGGTGVVGSSDKTTGVFGYSDGAHVAQHYAPFTFVGVHGQANGDRMGQYFFGYLSHVGVYADGGIKGCGIYAKGGDSTDAGSAGLAGVFDGEVVINGTLWKQGGGFRIDHPHEPAKKYLNHSFVESSERKNVYDGIAVLSRQGIAVIKLPAWFQELNNEFRYQLTAVGRPAPNLHIAKKIAQGRFTIAGGAAGTEVSWQVTGNRKDAWAKANPLLLEEEKPASVKLASKRKAFGVKSKRAARDRKSNVRKKR